MTVYSEFKITAEKNKNRLAVKWKQNERWQNLSYGEFLKVVDSIAFNLAQLGVSPDTHLAIFSENRWEWLATDLAINKLGAVSVPLHTIYKEDTLSYVLKDSLSTYLVISEALLKKFESLIRNFPDFKKIIVIQDIESDLSDNFVSFDSLLNNKQTTPSDMAVSSDDAASIIYTSGTTGEPKGVILTNVNFVTNVEAVDKRISILPTDIFLSFLPLSHVLERTAGSYVPILKGACIAYSENIKKLAENLQEIKPTILISVPKIFERMYEKIFAGIKEKGGLAKKMFFFSLKQKNDTWSKKLADKIILNKIRHKTFGGRLRLTVSGGASINEKILRFFTNINIKIVEGYGMTETAPIISANSLEKNKISSVGFPLEGVQVKIAADKEIMVKGENVMKGYWNKPEATREVFTEDGWLKTGDLGFIDPEGFLTIIGRKKDIIVTSNGKNVAPERLEGIINLSPLIDQSLVVGHRQSFLSVLIVPDYEGIKAKFGDEIDNKKVEEIIEGEITKFNNQLESHERIKVVKILNEPFTIEAGDLTPTLKLRRKIIENKYHDLIKSLYRK